MNDRELVDNLKVAVGLLELSPSDPLRFDLAAIETYLTHPNFRVVVFAPFNYGKSTLLNALLGENILPIDLIPTTGAAITVQYGEEAQTQIRFIDGTELNEAGTQALRQFAVLDDDRQMRSDVSSIRVQCPHSLLKTGLELVDLPGTDDQVAQDALVKTHLLTADLVVQVLDARKLMTLQEREGLRDWLLERGIETVIFVVNFLNLLEPDEQKQVLNRLRFVAESFRSKLPSGISNLYPVNALPALRARLKGDAAAAQVAGLPALESALQTIASAKPPLDRGRLKAITQPIQQALQAKIQSIAIELEEVQQAYHQRIEIKQKAQTLIQQGFTKSVRDLRNWLNLSNLLSLYEQGAIAALRNFDFEPWVTQTLRADWQHQQQSVVEWVEKACDFFEHPRPATLWMAFPGEPEIAEVPEPNFPSEPSGNLDVAPVAIATGLGWMFGGPVGAAVMGGASYLLNKTGVTSAQENTSDNASDNASNTVEKSNLQAVRDYLTQFSNAGLAAIAQYEVRAVKVMEFKPDVSPTNTTQQYELHLLQTTLEKIGECL
jgi:predicted GTPase